MNERSRGLAALLLLVVGGASGLRCHVCSVNLNVAGEPYYPEVNPLGVNPAEDDEDLEINSCWNLDVPENDYIEDCEDEADYCGLFIDAELLENGDQLYKIRRDCHVSNGETISDEAECTLVENEDKTKAQKSCKHFCLEEECNSKDLDESMAGTISEGAVSSCRACVGTDEECTNDFSSLILDCPFYADAACVNSRETEITNGDIFVKRITKGCSAFVIEDECHITTTTDSETGTHILKDCQGTCTEHPEDGFCNDGQPDNQVACYTCEYHQDHNGNIIGNSNPLCFDSKPSNKDIVVCGKEEQCLLDMEIDWRSNGLQEVIVKRGCGKQEDIYPQDGCIGNAETTPIPDEIYRDCNSLCTGDLCNEYNHWYQVALKHSAGTTPGELSCKTCSYSESSNGLVNGNEKCRDQADEVLPKQCPVYADHGCFSAGSWKVNTQNDREILEEDDHRGCSSFHYENLEGQFDDCKTSSSGSGQITSCKHLCEDSDCNTKALAKQTQCHVCRSSLDSEGNVVGTGDSACWGNAILTPLLDCDFEDAICVTEIQVDWTARANQVAQISRGCKKRGFQKEGCKDANSVRVQAKECATWCEGSGCNIDYEETAKLFNPSGPNVDSCHNCVYVESDDGSVNGNKNCVSKPDSFASTVQCPLYANVACYVGSNIHVSGDANVKEEVYRGCSSFQLDETDCHEENLSGTTGENHAYGVCKETCSLKNCNKEDHTKPELPIEGTYPLCNVCDVFVDQYNNTVGNGDPGCMAGGAEFNRLCPNKDDFCITEMRTEWVSRGQMLFNVIRSCSQKEASLNCISGENLFISYKDCAVTCDPLVDGPGCNVGLDEVADKFDNGNVKQCYACEYYENGDGTVEGTPNCYAEINPSNQGIPLLTCPRYANTACYHAASYHDDFVDAGESFTDDYRGCSPFVQVGSANRPYCFESNFGEYNFKSCKETCTSDYCNTKRIVKSNRCYVCRGQRNSMNETVGTGDDKCFDDVQESMIQDCAQDEDYCVDELLVDWLPKGEQMVMIRRACSEKPANGPCEEDSIDAAKYKDCQATCFNPNPEDTPCNSDLKVVDKFEFYQEKKIESCFACRFVENDDGSVEGNAQCENTDNIHQCPRYASAACYTGAAIHNTDDYENFSTELYKGCSTFVAINGAEEGKIGNAGIGNPTTYSWTKTSCSNNNCNVQHIQPEEPERPEPEPEPETNRCQACQVTVDQFERQVGTGQIGCWNGDKAFEVDCGEAEYCSVDMEIDWFPRGQFTYRVVRGCSKTPAREICTQSANDLVQYKDCQVSCEISKEGPGCNDGLLEISKKFSTGTVQNCHRCEYYENQNGLVSGFPGCGKAVDETNQIPVHTCPMFADTACYWAGSYHEDYVDSNSEFEDDFRGCSPFVINRETCYETSITGLKHLNCKGTCQENNCNTEPIVRHLQCHQCSATTDAEGKPVGAGDSRCFNTQVDGLFLADCPGGTTHCVSELQVDWFAKGQQVYTINRGCYNANNDLIPRNECDEAMTSRFLFKDCIVGCEEDGCNNDDSIFDLFQDEEGFMQTQCYACSYQELDNGDVEGNPQCGQTPPDDKIKNCPKWANKGCFTGSAVHNYLGKPKEEVYKGCSAFDLGGPLYSRDEIGGVEFDLIKDTCRDSPNCNTDHLVPTEKSCYTCSTRKDHMGNDFGFVDSTCWDNPSPDVIQPCLNEGDVCLTTMTIEWLPKGEQLIQLTRGCGSPVTAGGQSCVEETSDLIKVKTCTDICESPACNNDFKVSDLFDQGNDISCYSCQYGRWPDGTILPGSNINCQQSTANENVAVLSCPNYLNAGCFQATTWHFEEGSRIEENFRGCSAFALDQDDTEQCSDWVLAPNTYTNCRKTCSEDNCNMEKSQPKFSCYTCSETIDANGNQVGSGNDAGCFSDNPSSRYIQECTDGELYCSTDLEADWFYRGSMTWRVRRGCSKEPAAQECAAFASTDKLLHFKDCMSTCTDSNCNMDLHDVVEKFDSGNRKAVCYACSYVEMEDGSVVGNEFCLDEADKVQGSEVACPAYANDGCFVGSNVHKSTIGNREVEQVWKGCSSFVIDGPICASNPDFAVNDESINLATCKEFCGGNLCNREHIRPQLEEDEYNECHFCSVQMDHLGNTLGVGSSDCFNDPQNSMICFDGQVCQTQLTVEWYPRGEQITKLERRCAEETPTAGMNPCFETRGQGSRLKQCTEQCTGNKCNDNNDAVIDGFNKGQVQSCIGCTYAKYPDGSLGPNSNPKCMASEVSSDLSVSCPDYLNAACFTASTWHYDMAGAETEEDFKGCSAFALDEDETGCSLLDVNGEDHTACRQTCDENDCNNKTPVRKLSCYQCEVIVDSLNNTIGYGPESCWSENPERKYLQECPFDPRGEAEYCRTDIEADWLTTGQQTWRVKRSCAVSPAPENCIQQVDSDVHMKDCATSCQENGCNSGLYETAAKFEVIMPKRQCYHCELWEQENGDIFGNVNCADQPGLIPDAAKDCPIYATAGCYTGTNAHYNSDGIVREHVYKGCSSFTIPETNCGVQKGVTIDGIEADFGYCQEACFTNLCNEFHEHPTIDRRQCYQCRITKDHMGNTLGQGDDQCWNIPSGSDTTICDEGLQCITEMTVDWMPKGEQLVLLERKCGVEPINPGFGKCRSEQDDLLWSKTCSRACDEDLCNEDREVEQDFDQGNADLECYSCNYGEWYNGDSMPNSNIYCQSMKPLENVPKQPCPVYANAACFTAATWHFAPNGDEYEEDFRGCSAFDLEGIEQDCGSYVANGITHNTCRTTCDDGLCNREVSEKRLSCYTCTVTIDQNNNTVGSGNIGCLSDEPNTLLVEECLTDQSYCTVDIEADWFPLGQMQWTIRKGCTQKPAADSCQEFSDDGVYIKDCSSSCEESECNLDITEAATKFGNNNVDSCYSCSYKENNDGSVSGNKLCPDEPDQIDNGSTCPLYASAACFTASNAHYTPGNVLAEQVFKGCSSFITSKKCSLLEGIVVDGAETEIGVCRETCDSDNCNQLHEIAPIDRKTCYVCQVNRDFLGNTIGQGDASCWDTPSERTLQQCNVDEVCITEMGVEWLPRGEQMVTLHRKCGLEPINPGFLPCVEAHDEVYSAKVCQDHCDESKCNYNRDVENIFDQRGEGAEPLKCFGCRFGNFYNGAILPNSNKYCQNPVATEGTVPSVECPVYANAACFTAATWHYMPNGDEYEEDFKGCSAFVLEEEECGEYIVNGLTYSSCRSTCDGENCNALTPAKRLSCYSCDVTINMDGSVIGFGDERCASDSPPSDQIQTCSDEEPYCRTVMEADWMSRGNQQYRVTRGCSKEPEWESCPEFTNPSGQVYIKDCDSTCNSTLCNEDIESVTTQFSTNSDLSCYACTYLENDDGGVEGNKNCGSEEPPEEFKTKCPIFADTACFTGTNSHFTTEEALIEEIFKGCSSFYKDEADCSYLTDVIISGNRTTTYGICKESCTGDFCNVDHITPDVPTKAGSSFAILSVALALIALLL